METALKEHEVWLNDGVEKQKRVKANEDPAIETKDMRSKAKTLELHLQRLVRRRVPKVKKTPKSPETDEDGESHRTGGKQSGHDEL